MSALREIKHIVGGPICCRVANVRFYRTWRQGEAPRIRRAHFYHAKAQSRKEEDKEVAFFLSFAPSRLCVIKT
jgi:hypothetical protein